MDGRLGRLEHVDLRSEWGSEARDFTPWLAEEANLGLLGDTLGVELELEGMEQSVGPFNADLLCKEMVTDEWVIIENQLDKTDHGHLGQTITYAAGLGATTIVWIARRFREEHRAALDWLNEITSEDVKFFGVEVELWRIGNSPAAPKFNVVCKPNDWTKQVRRVQHDGELSDLKQLQREYWRAFFEVVEERCNGPRPRTPRPQSWTNLAVGRSNCYLSVAMNTLEDFLKVELNLTGDDAAALFELLRQEQEEIETEVGAELDWLPKPNAQRCQVAKYWHGDDPLDRDQWPEQHRTLADMLQRFYEAFSPRLKRMDVSSYEPDQPDTTTNYNEPDEPATE